MALDKKNLIVRTASGLIYAGLLVGMVIIGSVATAIVLAVFAVIAAYEIESNVLSKHNPEWINTYMIDAATLATLIFSCMLPHSTGPVGIFIWVILIFTRFFIQVFLKTVNPLKSLSIFAFEQFYIGVPLALFVVIVDLIPEHWVIVCALSMIWINDTGAYLIGSLAGRHKMFPRLSPKKSWEGFVGGLVFNIGAAFIFFYCFHLNFYPAISNVEGWIFIGICITAFSTIGDLFESMLKRSIGIKDFGSIIPGHGGVLDRIDSLLCVVPSVVFALILADLMFGI